MPDAKMPRRRASAVTRRAESSVNSRTAAGSDIRLAQALMLACILLPLGNQMGGTEQSRVTRIGSLLRPSLDASQWR